MPFQLVHVTSHDQLHNHNLDNIAPPKQKLISLCGRCSKYMAPYIHVGGYTGTHFSDVYGSETQMLNYYSRTRGLMYDKEPLRTSAGQQG